MKVIKILEFNLLFAILLICIIYNFSCNKKTNLMNFENETIVKAPVLLNSNVVLPLHIDENELNLVINTLIEKHFSLAFLLDNGYRAKIQVQKDVKFSAYANRINYTIPLFIELYPSAEITKIKADGIIAIELSTTLSSLQNKILSKTEYTRHQWVQAPQLKILGLPIPISAIADIFINKIKQPLCKSLDENISKSLDLAALSKKINTIFQKPLMTTDDQIIGLYASPSQMSIGPLSMANGELIIPLIMDTEAVIAEQKPSDLYNELNIEIQPVHEAYSDIYVQSRLPLSYIEQICRENVENQSYGSGITKLTVSKIKLSGYKETLRINLNTLGAFNGELEMSLSPKFDHQKKQIYFDNFSIKPVNGKTLDKALFSIIQGFAQNKVKSTLEEFFNTTLNDYINSSNSILEGKEIFPGTTLQGKLMDYNIADFNIYENRIYFNLNCKLMSKLSLLKFPLDKIQ